MISFMVVFLLAILILGIVWLDIIKKISLVNKNFISIYLIFVPHIILLGYFFIVRDTFILDNIIGKWIVLIEILIFISYVWIKLNIAPYSKKPFVNVRLRVMLGGRYLVLYGLYTSLIQTLLYLIWSGVMQGRDIPNHIFVLDIIVVILNILTLLTNGMLRILYTSRRLNIVIRLIVAFMSFIPVINIFAMLYACHLVASEYDHECYKVINNNARVDSEVCKTRYPIILVHGVGFRDLKYINYWGRIPRELIRNGAAIYYGNQEAWGTIEYNSEEIKNKIFQVLKETKSEKVNIIAHSKGGLDARYMISKLNMGKYVASLTMISSPHKGCKFVDLACKIPDKIYKAIARMFDKYYTLLGDKKPDFYAASRQFSTYNSKKFNEEVKDVPQVYYQSYASVMKNMFSDYILTIPYILVKLTEGENDGLVCVESAKWGNFKGVLRNKYRRGISHGDIIDMRREDYKDFDVIEKYVEIVSELKKMGY
ncbi:MULTISPECIES: acetyltransferase/hydrolase [unclassified Clostridium]|uniref:alpha/beta hydrolase n=1 Tax=unclassified Clostridium TaxID=2614128 RepID=UPI0002981A92|nr:MULTISPECIES: acetyltransferase/hydrolase [unclassified Clostridium]EKQ51683.1 MAG: putative acetyltransferase/hydrolase [Clostridium sp. Maddingley MBC34-26]